MVSLVLTDCAPFVMNQCFPVPPACASAWTISKLAVSEVLGFSSVESIAQRCSMPVIDSAFSDLRNALAASFVLATCTF